MRSRSVLLRWGAVVFALLLCIGCASTPKRTAGPPPDDDDDNSQPTEQALTPEQMEGVQRTVRAGSPSITRCYTEELDRRGTKKFRGHVVVKIHVGMATRALAVQIGESSLNAPAVHDCIKRTINGWEFPKLAKASWFTFPFKFEPAY
ncbi:MAG: AgmX/PglI C-terminal domain-containing protein [Myxococcales bacterium]|nr:AgmX/PglI C-terminal domain-containing protein [Myxococcales bacterium]